MWPMPRRAASRPSSARAAPSARPRPFNTTSLQAAAAAEGISPARTMRLAESLYMDGLISYPRVDNTVYPSSLDLRDCVRTLAKVPQYAGTCQALLSQPKLTATRGKQETTDHPPIYPTAAADPEHLQPAAWKLYNLIARRFLATLMGPATIEGTKVSIDVAGEPFTVSGSVLASPGFRAIYPYGLKKDDQLPALAEGDVVGVSDMELLAKQTEPPARYSQGKLIQEMEKRGLGTKSTRASIIDTLYERKYFRGDPVEGPASWAWPSSTRSPSTRRASPPRGHDGRARGGHDARCRGRGDPGAGREPLPSASRRPHGRARGAHRRPLRADCRRRHGGRQDRNLPQVRA